MNELELMDWFELCGHEIALVYGKKGYVGIAICNDTRDTFRVSGDDKVKVLLTLKDMLSGTYR